MPDDIITRDSEGQLAVNTVSGTEANVPYNYDDCFTIDTNGRRALRVVGGGDLHNKGYYATPEALAEACPTAEAGDYAIVGSTDTVWVWDEDSSQWVDTDTKGQVTPDMIIVKSATMPTASTVPAGAVYQYVGTTTSSYTHGYIYENKTIPVYDSTVEFNPASVSGTTVACSGSDFAAFVAEFGSGDIDTIIKGTITYNESGELLVFVGQDDTDTTVCTFQVYTQDYVDAGFTFTGTLADGDVIAFTCTITESESYSWERIDVQPTPEALPSQSGQSGKFLTTDGTSASWGTVGGLPDQTGQSGKFLTTDGSAASWSNKPLVNNTANQSGSSVSILGVSNAYGNCVAVGVDSNNTDNSSVSIGKKATASSEAVAIGSSNTNGSKYTYANAQGSIAIGFNTHSSGKFAIAIGDGAIASAMGAIQIGTGTNSEAGTVYVGLYGTAYQNIKLLESDGTIPPERLGTGYDATKTQTLKNVQGVLTWVDD